MVWKGDARGRLAKSLVTLIDQVDAKWPNRAKHSDGSIGDTAHAARASDHNPGDDRVVEALDITHDPANGVDTWRLAEIFRQNQDQRIDYVISNGRVFVGLHGKWNGKNVGPWNWIKYTGTNSHAQHVHVSVDPRQAIYDLTNPWKLTIGGAVSPAPQPPKPKGITSDMRSRMMQVIMSYEGKIPPQVFIAPDGRPEIAGITQKDHPAKYAELKKLLDDGNTQALTNAVIAYYLDYTAPAQNWTDRAGPEFFLRDCILNRGPTGAAEILQDAVGVPVDGQVGPTTRGALASFSPDAAIDRLRASRERYEDRKYPGRRTSGQWQGMLNRWNKAQAQAKAFQKEQGKVVIPKGVVEVGSGGLVAGILAWLGAHPIVIVLGAAAVIGLVIYFKNRGK